MLCGVTTVPLSLLHGAASSMGGTSSWHLNVLLTFLLTLVAAPRAEVPVAIGARERPPCL